jgi:multicomponent Na+:H+ antiporter subunit D
MINQIGFMVVGIGLGTELGLNGAVAHSFNDVLFKGLLFMSMGAVLYRTGKINGSELGGLYKSMPVTTGLCMVGAASISAFPLFSGFVSKSMVMASAMHEGYIGVWLVLLFASAGVFHHAGIKIPFFAFFAHDSGIRCKEAPRNMLLAMGLAAALSMFNGCFPWAFLYRILPYEVDYLPYTSAHVISQLQILFFSALAFTWLKLSGLYPPELRSVNLDSDWLYRRLMPAAARQTLALGRATRDALRGWIAPRVDKAMAGLYHYHGPEGVVARTWAVSSAVLWVVVLLFVVLAVYFY